MKQEDKDLLLRDISSRLLYGVKVSYIVDDYEHDVVSIHTQLKNAVRINGKRSDSKYDKGPEIVELWVDVEDIKPYLFPLSSMTEEQYESLKESGILSNCSHSYEYVNPHIHGVSFIFKEFKTYSLELIEWLNKNHFDYRGLIPKGLAANATGLNIY